MEVVMDKIEVVGIRCPARIGVPDNERQFPQELLVDVVCEFEFAPATEKDDFRQTVDYETIVENIRTTAVRHSWSLLETLTNALCDSVLAIPGVRVAEIRVKKFPVSLREKIDYVVASVRRTRSSP